MCNIVVPTIQQPSTFQSTTVKIMSCRSLVTVNSLFSSSPVFLLPSTLPAVRLCSGLKRALSRLCTCASSDASHCLIANRNQGNTPGKFIPSLCFFGILLSVVTLERYLTSFLKGHSICYSLLCHISKFITFRKVKRRNSNIKLKPNAGIKHDPNKTISDHRCEKERERYFKDEIHLRHFAA